jgi:hypothetical protein
MDDNPELTHTNLVEPGGLLLLGLLLLFVLLLFVLLVVVVVVLLFVLVVVLLLMMLRLMHQAFYAVPAALLHQWIVGSNHVCFSVC